MTQRQRLRAAKICIAGRLLLADTDLRRVFGHRAIDDILNTLLKQAKMPMGASVPDQPQAAIDFVMCE